MNASEKNSFEEQWRDAFENAEVTPDPAIWATIETHLADAEANKYKRQLYVFKLRVAVAAAAALLILATGSWLVWQSTHSQPDVVAQKTATQPDGSAVTAAQSPRHSSAETTTPEQVIASHKNQNSISTPSVTLPNTSSRNSNEVTADNQNSIRTEAKTPALTPQAEETVVAVNPAAPKKQSSVVDGQNGLTSNHSTQTLARTNKKQASRSRTNAFSDAKNSIFQKNKTPGIGTPPLEDATLVETVVAVQTEQAEDSRVSVQSLTARTITAQKANMPKKDIRWQLNQAFWDEVAAADAKEQAQKAAKKSRWQIGAGITPGSFNPNFSSSPSNLSYAGPNTSMVYGMDRTVTNAVVATAPQTRTNLNNLTRPGVSYNTGVQAEFAISERFSVQGGVQYTYNQSQIEMTQYVKVNEQSLPAFYELFTSQSSTYQRASTGNFLDATNGYTASFNTNGDTPLKNTYQYMGFPMRFLYKVLNKKIKTSVGAGVSADLFLRSRISSDGSAIQALDGSAIQSIEFTSSQNSIYKNMSMSGLLSIKVDYSMGNRYSIYLEPTYRRAITSFTTSSTLDSYPSWWGIGTGIQYRF